MAQVGLWIQAEGGEPFLIKKDAHGYPDLVPLRPNPLPLNPKDKKEICKTFYEDLTGKPYAHPNATSRQVLWDFLEVAIQHLP